MLCQYPISASVHLQKIYKYSLSWCANRSLFCYSKCIPALNIVKPRFLQSTTPVILSSQTFWETFPHLKPFLHLKDGLDKEQYELIYHCRIFNYVFYGQVVCLAAFASQLFGASYYAYLSYIAQEVVGTTSIGPFTVTYDAAALIILVILTIQNFLIYVAAQAALLRAYHNAKTDDYIFVVISVNPFKCRYVSCKPGELKNLNIYHIGQIFGNHSLKDHRLYIRYDKFKSIWHYNRLVDVQPKIR